MAEIEALKTRGNLAASLNRRVSWLFIDETRLNGLVSVLFLFLNLFGLLKLVMFLVSLERLKTSRTEIRSIYEAIGSLDAHIAVASYTESVAHFTTPVFAGTGGLDVSNIYHPLIERAVPNSFVLRKESALITGSNLAGKTTFIKTIGVNVILARTLFLCLAEAARLPWVIVRSSIKHDERVTDGQSYYSRQIEEIREFIECAPGRFLFLIDEIFRGTNTVERIAIAAATIRHLSADNMVLVTTHDIELEELLKNCVRMFHFSEQIEGSRYFFDYVLRPGACRSGNAIRLIELQNYPAEVVAETRLLAGSRLTRQQRLGQSR